MNADFPTPDISVDFFSALGCMDFLALDSQLHQSWPVVSVEDKFLPALEQGQCKIYYSQDKPSAFVIWAFVDDATHQRLLKDGVTPDSSKWNSGDNLWFIDIVAPFGNALCIVRDLQRNHFPGHHAHSIKRNPNGSIARIKRWRNRVP